jgi:signal transduction histidine kinase
MAAHNGSNSASSDNGDRECASNSGTALAECDRRFALRRYGIVDTPPEEAFDRVAELAASVADTAIGLVSLVETNRQWHKAAVGTDVREIDRRHSFCTHAIETEGPMVVADLRRDDRFRDNPYVDGRAAEGPPLRFYAGAPLVTPEGYRLGTVCTLGVRPQSLPDAKVRHLQYLADLAMERIEERLQWNREARQAVRLDVETEQEYRTALRHSPIVLARVDRDLRYEWVYNAHTDFAPEQMQGRRDDEIDTGPGVDELMALKRQTLAQAEQRRREITFERSNGTITYDITATPIQDEDGDTVVGVLTAALDVTDRKRCEKELERAKAQAREAARLKSALLSNVNHEFRTPLTSIISFSRLIDEHPELAGDFARRILSGGKRLLRTLNTVMDFAALEGGEMTPTFRLIDLRSAVEKAARNFQADAEREGLTLRTAMADGPVSGRLDPYHTERICVHLLSNAVKFTESGTVTIGVEQTDDGVALWVEDSGIGIDPAFQPQVFDEFAQSSSGVARTHDGNGLGLTIVRRLVQQMDGTIELDSTPGQGTRVTVRFSQTPLGEQE